MIALETEDVIVVDVVTERATPARYRAARSASAAGALCAAGMALTLLLTGCSSTSSAYTTYTYKVTSDDGDPGPIYLSYTWNGSAVSKNAPDVDVPWQHEFRIRDTDTAGVSAGSLAPGVRCTIVDESTGDVVSTDVTTGTKRTAVCWTEAD